MSNLDKLVLHLDYISLSGDFYFEIRYGTKQIGELEIMDFPDSYTVKVEAYTDFFIKFKGEVDDAIDYLFEQLFDTIENNMLVLFEEKPILLLEDERFANRFAINHNLERVPRYCGFYLSK